MNYFYRYAAPMGLDSPVRDGISVEKFTASTMKSRRDEIVKWSLKWLLVIFIAPNFLNAQTIQAELPDSVIQKLQCKKLWSIVDASRDKFKKVRGGRKPYKYSEIYAAKVTPKGVKNAQITVEGRVSQYTAVLVNSPNRMEAAKAYTAFLPQIEICLEGWIFETELEDENQIYRFKAYEKEDMSTGVTVEIVFRKEKKRFLVELTIQP